MKTEILIVGTGCAGLYCALQLPGDKKITLITKSKVEESDSYLAQGGICILKDENDYNSFFEDTLKAGHFENDRTSVDIMISSSRDLLNDLLSYGVDFQRDENGELLYTKEGAHSSKRILFHKDITGKEITSRLYFEAKKRENIEIIENTALVDIIEKSNKCYGAILRTGDGKIDTVLADKVVLATGGIGGLYKHSTNYKHLRADSVAIAIKHKIRLQNVSYVQIHPTTLYSKNKEDRSFLISESVRGEGARLYDKNMERFTDELLPRDKLTEKIFAQMEIDGTEFVWEDLRTIPRDELISHFPNIIEHCKNAGYDVFNEPIPVVPAQHYYMGGVWVDYNSKTSMDNLYAVGEAACNGVHGKNRLASNSLLESLVFAKRCALDIAKGKSQNDTYDTSTLDLSIYENQEKLEDEYKNLVLKEIEKEKSKGDMSMFDNATLRLQVDPLILSALKEDITSEDVSTNSVMPKYQAGEVDLICKENGVICGLQVFERVFKLLDENTRVEFYVTDGDFVKKGQLMAKVRGDIRVLLSGERVALNYLQRMSGIATYTHSVASLLDGTKTKLLDTRKTTPNNRIFEKYSVRVGGGNNHRYNLSDGVLLKDNHIGAAGGVKEAILMAKEYAPFVRKIEIEVENLDMVKEAVEAGAHIIMLDNMSHEEMAEAIQYINGRAEVEVSGNVTKENIARLTDLGVDFISSGALTHSSPILDISLKNLHPVEEK
ncbi:MAG: L-aspartate oxidase [Clostridia bacterium]|nr:L-aspartate oxidase [Clostridia bacterium]